MGEYRFLSAWLLDSPREAVWGEIYDAQRWPQWWRGVELAEKLAAGDARGVGQHGRYVWRGPIPYAVAFDILTTRVEPPHLIEARASGGLAGVGRWRLYEAAGTTAVLYEWNVRTTKRWMNAVAPFGKPLFVWNHDRLMLQGARGLADRLGCELIAAG